MQRIHERSKVTNAILLSFRRWLCAAAAAAAALTALSEPTAAATWFWGPGGDVTSAFPLERKRIRPPRPKLPELKLTDKNRPDGPLIINISIQQQRVKVYDRNGLYAESPISTGMAGHPTPLGVFSVIEKQKWHRSNIYSGAPMPYMQRITWSGIAMHQGVLPGYPASHGCIRMPAAFAMKLWSWSTRGARVIITPGEISPSDFSHPKLIVQMLEEPNLAASGTPSIADTSSAKADGKLAERLGHAQAHAELRLTTLAAAATGEQAAASAPEPKAAAGATSARARETRASDNAEVRADQPPARPASVNAPAASVDTPPLTTPAPDVSDIPTVIGPKRTGHVAVFISRKERKLFVRQNFSPLFDVPITIADVEKPLGTFVLTARSDKADANALRWSVVALPTTIRRTVAGLSGKRNGKPGRAAVETVLVAPTTTAADALDRIAIPEAALERIAQTIKPGGSIVISDQGLGDETGLGTDFIVPLR